MLIRLLSLVILLFAATCTSESVPITQGDQPKNLSGGLQVLEEWRSESEQWVARIKGDYAKGREPYETAQSLYIPAKAAAEGWLKRLKTELAEGKDLNQSKEYKADLSQASERSRQFFEYAKGLYPVRFKSRSFGVAGDVIAALTASGISIWKEYRATEEGRRMRIAEQLESLKWKSFGDIPAEK